MSGRRDPIFAAISEVIADELFARISVRDDLETKQDAEEIAELVADALVYRFEIRERERKD